MINRAASVIRRPTLERLGKRGPVSRARVSNQTANVGRRFKDNGVLIGQPQRLPVTDTGWLSESSWGQREENSGPRLLSMGCKVRF